jgi:hypothetical protein
MSKLGMRVLDAPDFAEGKQRAVRLPVGDIVAALLLRVRFDLVVTGGTGAGTVYDDAVFRILRAVTVRYDGTDQVTLTGQTLRILNRLFQPEEYPQTPPALTAGTHEVEAQLFVPLNMPWSNQQDDFALPTTLVRNPELLVDWGWATDLYTGEDATGVAIQNADVDLYSFPVEESTRPPQAFAPFLTTRAELPVTQAGTRVRLRLENLRPNMEVRAVLLEAFEGGTAGGDYEYSDALVTAASLNLNRRNVFEQIPFTVLQGRNKVAYALEAPEAGVAVFDAAEAKNTGRGQLWRVAGNTAQYLELDLAAPTGDSFVRATVLATARP